MPIETDETGSWHTNCERAEEFKSGNPEDYETALKKLAELEDIRLRIKELREIETDLCAEVYELLPKKEMDIGGLGRVTKSMGSSKKWDHEGLWYTLSARARDKRITKVDPETGEITVRESVEAATMRILKECSYVSYWRAGKLTEYGVDKDEYCETTWTKPGIRIQGIKG
jgi:hypothetical protein